MCDTMVALGNSTETGRTVFAKNSDREPNEPLLTVRVPRRQHEPGARLKCTYIEIDQVGETFEALLLKPSWMWGAEMGSNEFGLAIGNEAVFTREKQGPPALLGMDMLRLALERCCDSEEALELMIDLLGRHGQGGNCGYEKKFYYHNSFLIADPHSAWVLETAGQFWAAEKVRGVRAISNRLSIGKSFDRGHPDLVRHAVDRGWCRGEKDFDFARCYSDSLFTRFSGSLQRQGGARCRLEEERGKITPDLMKEILRSHEDNLAGRQFSRHSLKSVCMHGGFIFGSHTTGSLVAELDEVRPFFLLTGGSTPCIGLFKPLWLTDNEPFTFREGQEDAALAFWMKRERLHRYVLENRISDLKGCLQRRDRVEEEIGRRLATVAPGHSGESDLDSIVAFALAEEENLLDDVFGKVKQEGRPAKVAGNPYFRRYWKKATAGLFGGVG